MALEIIPDRAGREVAFESMLDELLTAFSPGWELPPIMEGEERYHCNEVKRFQVGEAATQDLEATRQYADLLIRAAVHDQCRSGIRQLIEPLVKAIGHRQVQSAIVDYMRTGSDVEKVGASMAWYFARPGLQYASMEDLRRGVPTQESKSELEALADLRDDYRAACLSAFLTCEIPETRQDLSLDLSLDATSYPAALQDSHEKARRIILADPERYRLLLERCTHASSPIENQQDRPTDPHA
ncbi:hypothetical protein OHS33_36350 [Streptomyces sp. NBC_00536]|uniref:hypothetical protein n=1 Tax=Streptomyces sp. NBC_00536 TaxID=2975769 RepID=UPI002E805C99|nr:hypothetical protein [Streptomyces sp. NBC_00536]WUC83367.1 hypothetical protein OHS33_36350 [Streptomyces sp. NBC_00536]